MAGLKGKTGIVTGGSSGIGFQIANVLAQAGATVYVISRTGKPKEGVGESAPGVVHLQGDIGNPQLFLCESHRPSASGRCGGVCYQSLHAGQ